MERIGKTDPVPSKSILLYAVLRIRSLRHWAGAKPI